MPSHVQRTDALGSVKLVRGEAQQIDTQRADVDRFCMQSDESARRIIELGADPSRVTVTGSLKFDSLELPAVVCTSLVAASSSTTANSPTTAQPGAAVYSRKEPPSGW